MAAPRAHVFANMALGRVCSMYDGAVACPTRWLGNAVLTVSMSVKFGAFRLDLRLSQVGSVAKVSAASEDVLPWPCSAG